MEHVRETAIPFRGEKKLSREENCNLASIQIRKDKEIIDKDCSLPTPTPEKRIQPPRSRKCKNHGQPTTQENDTLEQVSKQTADENRLPGDDSSVTNVHHSLLLSKESLKEKTGQLSEKYKILVEVFDQMVVSVRLLRLRKRLPSFHNISAQVEILTKKKFLPGYLAQMKYLLPDAIQIEKILKHDELSLCMKSDLRVSLIVDAVKSPQKSQQASYVDLCQAFRVRLLDFLNSHPEDADIPEAPILDTSSRINYANSPDQMPVASPVDQTLSVPSNEGPMPPSHLSSSFRGYFSKKTIDHDEQMTEACSTSISLLKEVNSSEVNPISPVKGQSIDKTPVKLISGPVKLMTKTPAQLTPERPVGSPSVTLTRRALHYSPSKSDDMLLEKTCRRPRVLASLPGTVNAITSFIGASNSSTITKQELVHKILSYNCDLEDPCEVEEQLSLLEELVPDWIRRLTMSTGDLMYCISRASDLSAVQARLVANPC